MKRLFPLIIPILIAGCANVGTGMDTTLKDISVSIIPASKVAPRTTDTMDVDAPLRQLTKIEVQQTTPYIQSVDIQDGKKVREVRDTIESGTTVAVTITPANESQNEVLLDIQHICPPHFAGHSLSGTKDIHIDLPKIRQLTLQQRLLIKKGDALRISTASARAGCSGQDIIIHPIELPLS